MSITLRPPIDLYFTSENAHDLSAIDRCFAPGGVVRDEGKIIKGSAAIKAWRVETSRKYHHTVEPLAVSARDGREEYRDAEAKGLILRVTPLMPRRCPARTVETLIFFR
jgi:hypothetical protein